MTAFRVGMRVTCIKDSNWSKKNGYILPVVGAVYTIGELLTAPNGMIGIRLVEIPMQIKKSSGLPIAFQAENFRPVVERKTSIAIFHEILKTQRVRTPA